MRRFFNVLGILGLTAVLAACGGGTPTEQAAAEQTAAKQGAAFPVTIEQKLGAVTIEQRPERVVALDFPSADAAIALGVVPVGMAKIGYVDGGIQQWTKQALDDQRPQLFDTTGGFPLERIAALNPDVILATNTYPLIADYWDKLNAIAPVVGHVKAPGVDTWQQGVRQVGKALGKSAQAQQLIKQVETKIAQARQNHPEFDGKTVSFFNYVAGSGLHVIDNENDFSIKFLKDLGFAGLTDAVARLESPAGRTNISPERYNLIDADIIIGTSPDRALLDQLAGKPLFSRISAVQRGAFVPLGIGPATSLAFPSVLSVPYALEHMVPKLADALRR